MSAYAPTAQPSQPQTPVVSAIMPVYNGVAFLAQALDSALAQTLDDLEVIVVDDGSTDGSGALADAYAAQHPAKVRVIHQPNGGLCLARNAGLAAARGEFIALLDADDVWLPHHLSECVTMLRSRRDVMLAHADIVCIDAVGHPTRIVPNRWKGAMPAWDALFLRKEHVSCPTAVFRRSVVDRIGAFDVAFNRMGCEDRDMWLRIAAVGPLAYIDRAHAHYREHGQNMSVQAARMDRARRLLVDKHGANAPGRQLRRYAYAAIYRADGQALRMQSRHARAAAAFLRSLRYEPESWVSWKGLLAALLRRTLHTDEPLSTASTG